MTILLDFLSVIANMVAGELELKSELLITIIYNRYTDYTFSFFIILIIHSFSWSYVRALLEK